MHINDLQLWFDRLGSFLLDAPQEIWLAAFFLPIVLALFSRRTLVFLGSVLAAAIGLVVILKLASITLVVATAAFVSSFLLAIFGIQARRKESAMQTELMSLREETNELRNSVEQHFLAKLNERTRRSKMTERETNELVE